MFAADGAGSSSDESDAQSIYEDIFGEDGMSYVRTAPWHFLSATETYKLL